MRRAFTLIELIIVVGIIGFLVALIMPSFGTWRERTVVQSTARDIESILKLARSKSLASEGGAKYGVQFITGSAWYQLCKNAPPSASCDKFINEYDVPSALSFCADTTVVFSKLTGEYENLDPSADLGTIYFYNKNKTANPCSQPSAIVACLTAKTCGGVTITKSGIIYEVQ